MKNIVYYFRKEYYNRRAIKYNQLQINCLCKKNNKPHTMLQLTKCSIMKLTVRNRTVLNNNSIHYFKLTEKKTCKMKFLQTDSVNRA